MKRFISLNVFNNRKIIFSAALFLTLLIIAGCGGGKADAPSPLDAIITKGADRLVNTQNNDGGWEWENPDTIPTTGLPSPSNTLGVTAQGLLDAYRISNNSVYLAACIGTYNRMFENAKDTDPEKHRMRGPDITFLVELSEVTGDSKYAAFAKTRYEAAISDNVIDPVTTIEITHTATGLAEYIRDRRIGSPALISWDINLYIQGVLALNRYYPVAGFDADAKSMAEVIYNSLYVANDFDFTATSQNSYWLAYTGAIEAFTTTGRHLDKIDSLKTALAGSQHLDGSFPESGGDSVLQTTAYAVMALLKAGENDAAEKGVQYLVNTQSVDGIWIENGKENTESDSEAIQAIYDFK